MKPFEHQVAGHDLIKFYSPEKIVKPLIEKEALFYELAVENHSPLLHFIPKYYGRISIDGQNYIMLENLLHGFDHPSMIDIKIGKRSYDDEACPRKIASMTEKDRLSTSSTLGFRISGMKIWNPVESRYDLYIKSKCKLLSANENSIVKGLEIFFSFLGQDIKKKMIERITRRIDHLSSTLKDIHAELYSASLFLVMESSVDHGAHENYKELGSDLQTRLSLIDFAHSKWMSMKNNELIHQDFLDGLHRLNQLLKEMDG